MSVHVGDEIGKCDCYFSRDDGETAVPVNQIKAGDMLFWCADFAGYRLTSSDTIQIAYEESDSKPEPDEATTRMEEESALSEVIMAARTIQDFLWGKHNAVWNLEEWRRMFRKRVVKIDEVDPSNPHAAIELKKRLLQTAALAVAMISRIEREGMPGSECSVPSNLSEYNEPIIDNPDGP
jgi:hypothetical protein